MYFTRRADEAGVVVDVTAILTLSAEVNGVICNLCSLWGAPKKCVTVTGPFFYFLPPLRNGRLDPHARLP